MEPDAQYFSAAFAARDAKLLRENVTSALAMYEYECILHPLGFYLIRLASSGDTTIRLHYWPARYRERGTAITPYHDHVWSLCSCVLSGEVENVLLELELDELGDFQIADINQFSNIDEVVPASSRVRINAQLSEKYGVDEFYEVLPRIFHYTNVDPEDATVTLVQATIAVQGGPRTLLPFGSEGHMPSREPILGSENIMIEISQLLNRENN